MEPRASGSGFTWQARATRGESAKVLAARSSSAPRRSLTGGALFVGVALASALSARLGPGLRTDLLEQLGHPLHLGQADVLLELELGRELEPNLLPEHSPEVGPSRLEPGPGGPMVPVLPEHRVI